MKTEETFLLSIPWAQCLEKVNWLKNCRDGNVENARNINESLNSSIIVNCCIIIEGVIFTSLKDHVADAQRKLVESSADENLYSRIWNDYVMRIESAQFSRYLDLIAIVTGKRIQDSMEKEDFEAMRIMFQFRNQLVHGNEIAFNVHHDGKEILKVASDSKYQSIYEYGKKKNLIKQSLKPAFVQILTDEYADHFFDMTKRMIVTLIQTVDSNINKYLYHRCKGIIKEEKND